MATCRSALACSSRLVEAMCGRGRMRPPTVKALPCRRAVALICAMMWWPRVGRRGKGDVGRCKGDIEYRYATCSM